MASALARALAGALGVGLAACSMAPDYARPAAPVAARWQGVADGHARAADLGWRQVLGDERLRALVARALAGNRDLRVAALNVELVRAQHRITRAGRWPQLDGRAAASYRGGALDTPSTYSVGLGAAFELDLFGRLANLEDQALETYLASEETHRAAHLALVAEVATTYLDARALDEELALAEKTLAALRESHELTVRIFEAGQRSELDVRTAEAQVETARAEVARVRRARAQADHALAVLIGGPLPASLPPPAPFDAPDLIADIPVGLPSEVLLRRPDVLAAEHGLKAANAGIGAARAAFFPRISLTAFGGLVSDTLSGLLSGDAGAWTFDPELSVPLFAGGGRRADLAAAHVRRRIEVARYEAAIQTAFREVADGLVARATLTEQLEATTRRVAAEERRFQMSELRYRTGIENYLVVLTAQRDLFEARQQRIAVQLARWTGLVRLYTALGGGWHERAAPR
jgi:multidrug efflux system outer membrane protein